MKIKKILPILILSLIITSCSSKNKKADEPVETTTIPATNKADTKNKIDISSEDMSIDSEEHMNEKNNSNDKRNKSNTSKDNEVNIIDDIENDKEE